MNNQRESSPIEIPKAAPLLKASVSGTYPPIKSVMGPEPSVVRAHFLDQKSSTHTGIATVPNKTVFVFTEPLYSPKMNSITQLNVTEE